MLTKALIAMLISCAPGIALPILDLPAGVDPSRFRVTTFASGLSYPVSMQVLPDNSLLVALTDASAAGGDYIMGNGSLWRLTDPGNTGVASGPGSVVYSGLPYPAQSVRMIGNDIVAVSQGYTPAGVAQIAFLKIGADPNAPYTHVGTLDFTPAVNGLFPNIAMETRPTPGVPGSYDLFFSVTAADPAAQLVAISGLVNGSIPLGSVGKVTLQPTGGAPLASGLQQVAGGLRVVGGIVVNPDTGDLFINDNGGETPTVQVDELNGINAAQIGLGVVDFGWPANYTEFQTGVFVGGAGTPPLATFQPFPDPFTGNASRGVAEMALAPGLFPDGLNNGLFITFYGTWEQAGPNNTTGPVLYYDFATGQYRPFILSGQSGIGHLASILAAGNSLYIADMSSGGMIRSGTPNGVIYQIQALAETPETSTFLLCGIGLTLCIGVRGARGRKIRAKN